MTNQEYNQHPLAWDGPSDEDQRIWIYHHRRRITPPIFWPFTIDTADYTKHVELYEHGIAVLDQVADREYMLAFGRTGGQKRLEHILYEGCNLMSCPDITICDLMAEEMVGQKIVRYENGRMV